MDDLLSAPVLRELEERYWRPVEVPTSLEALLADVAWTADPGGHVALYSDHGVVHVRDVAQRAAALAESLQGVLIERRAPQRARFVSGCSVLMTYLHDIGMAPANTAGRKVHAQFASQTVFDIEFDRWASALWDTDAGGVPSRITELHASTPLRIPGDMVLREVLAMAMCHSKSVVPAELLDDAPALRAVMSRATFMTLAAQLPTPSVVESTSPAAKRYLDMGLSLRDDAFAWLVDPDPAAQAFVHDVVDAVRVLRAADALRQRGTTHRTSSGFEVCTSRRDGEAVCTMRSADRAVVVALRSAHPKCCSEANLRAVEITPQGRLRVAMHRADFVDADVAVRHAADMADTVIDIERDALASFRRPFPGADHDGTVEIVRPHDNPHFASLLLDALVEADPTLRERVVLVDEPATDPRPEVVDWGGRGEAVDPSSGQAGHMMRELHSHGLHPDVDQRRAFVGVRRVNVRSGEQVLAAGTVAEVVLVAMGPGMMVRPMGGYPPDPVAPWTLLGATGAVRGAERNADVWAEETVDVLVIPIDVYLAEWYRPYDLAELRARATSGAWRR